MAEVAAIQAVRQSLGPDSASDAGFDDAAIGALLDSGTTAARIASSWWRLRVAATSAFVSISESGSTRNLAEIHKNALAMLEYWDKQVTKEEDAANGITPKRTNVRIGRITRV